LLPTAPIFLLIIDYTLPLKTGPDTRLFFAFPFAFDACVTSPPTFSLDHAPRLARHRTLRVLSTMCPIFFSRRLPRGPKQTIQMLASQLLPLAPDGRWVRLPICHPQNRNCSLNVLPPHLRFFLHFPQFPCLHPCLIPFYPIFPSVCATSPLFLHKSLCPLSPHHDLSR